MSPVDYGSTFGSIRQQPSHSPLIGFSVNSMSNRERQLRFSKGLLTGSLLRIDIEPSAVPCLTLTRDTVVELRDALTEVLDRGFA